MGLRSTFARAEQAPYFPGLQRCSRTQHPDRAQQQYAVALTASPQGHWCARHRARQLVARDRGPPPPLHRTCVLAPRMLSPQSLASFWNKKAAPAAAPQPGKEAQGPAETKVAQVESKKGAAKARKAVPAQETGHVIELDHDMPESDHHVTKETHHVIEKEEQALSADAYTEVPVKRQEVCVQTALYTHTRMHTHKHRNTEKCIYGYRMHNHHARVCMQCTIRISNVLRACMYVCVCVCVCVCVST